MAPRAERMEVRFLTSLAEITSTEWNRLAGRDYPFLRHEFLALLETTGCCTSESGWQPCHATLYRGKQLIALMPLYLKSHSYGEYVFDWSWADAWRRSGLDYYPKLVTAAPFTPATGPRLCLAAGEREDQIYPRLLTAVQQFAERKRVSSWHVLFPSLEEGEALRRAGTVLRTASQFHWFNQDYLSFDDFLARCNSRKRKSLKRERRRVQEQGVTLQVLEGNAIEARHWEIILPVLSGHLRQAQRPRRLSEPGFFPRPGGSHSRTLCAGAGLAGAAAHCRRTVFPLLGYPVRALLGLREGFGLPAFRSLLLPGYRLLHTQQAAVL